jgi:hypothetical protein
MLAYIWIVKNYPGNIILYLFGFDYLIKMDKIKTKIKMGNMNGNYLKTMIMILDLYIYKLRYAKYRDYIESDGKMTDEC